MFEEKSSVTVILSTVRLSKSLIVVLSISPLSAVSCNVLLDPYQAVDVVIPLTRPLRSNSNSVLSVLVKTAVFPTRIDEVTPAFKSILMSSPLSLVRDKTLFDDSKSAPTIISSTNPLRSISTVDKSDLVSIIVLPTKEPESTPPDIPTSNVFASPRVNTNLLLDVSKSTDSIL